jgi:DNA-binding response OmpR family regulator
MKSILVVDDEPRIAELARDYLEHAGFGVRIATTREAALQAVRRDRPDLVVLDLGLPGIDGSTSPHDPSRLEPAGDR